VALGVILLVVALNQRAQSERLKHDGVVVDVTVTTCIGSLGGSGSNAASYTCSGTFTVDGRTFTEVIGGVSAYVEPGTAISAVVDPGHPADLSATVPTTSWTVFLPPLIVFALAVLLGLFGLWRASLLRRRAAAGGADGSDAAVLDVPRPGDEVPVTSVSATPGADVEVAVVRLGPDLARAVSARAVELRSTPDELVRRAVREYLDRRDEV
jgi:hypothetical protein